MAEGFRKRGPERLLIRSRRRRGRGRRRAQGQREWQDQQHQRAEHHQRRLPAEIVDHSDAERRKQKLSERAGRGSETQRDAALVRWQQLGEGGQDQIEGAAGQTEADHDAGSKIEGQWRCRITHQQQAAGIEQRTAPHHAHGTEPIGDRASQRLPEPPQQVLQRDRKAEDVAAPREVAAHRLDEKAEAGAWTETQHADRAAAGDDDERRPPGRETRPRT